MSVLGTSPPPHLLLQSWDEGVDSLPYSRAAAQESHDAIELLLDGVKSHQAFVRLSYTQVCRPPPRCPPPERAQHRLACSVTFLR